MQMKEKRSRMAHFFSKNTNIGSKQSYEQKRQIHLLLGEELIAETTHLIFSFKRSDNFTLFPTHDSRRVKQILEVF